MRGACWLIVSVLVIGSAGTVPAYALDPSRAVTQYGLQNWAGRAGFSDDAVYDITQSSDGYLWLRTSGGVIRFDGFQAKRLELVVSNQPIREAVRAFCRGADGQPLIRTGTRTLRHHDGGLTDLLTPSPVPSGVARTLFETSDHRVWVGTDCSLNTIRDGALAEVVLRTGLVSVFTEDRRGNVWAGTSAGLYQLRGDRVVKDPSAFAPIVDVRCLAEDRRGDLWVGTSGGLYRLVDGQPPEYVGAAGIAGKMITAILEDRGGTIWVGTSTAGLFRLAGWPWEVLTASNGLNSSAILSLFEDREESLWVGTDGGLNQLRDTNLATITTMEGLPNNDTYAVLEARDGSVYVSTAGGLARIHDNAVTTYTTKDGLPNDYGTALFEGRDGGIWVGTGSGLCRLKDGSIQSYGGDGPLKAPCVTAINEDELGLIVATTGTPLLRLRTGRDAQGASDTFTLVEDPTMRDLPYVFTISASADGTLWYGTALGLYRHPAGEPEVPANEPGITFPVTSIFDDGRGSLWLAGRTPGVTRYRIADGRITSYTTAEGLFDDELTRAVCNRAGDLWASSSRGIFRVKRRDLDDFAEGRVGRIRSVAYGRADGMRTIECTIPEHQTAGWCGRDGRLWFTTRKGIVVVDPSRFRVNEKSPPVIIEQVVVDQTQRTRGPEIRLAPGSSRIEFHYTGLSLRVPERVRFRYRLEGFDRDWIDAGGQRIASYTNLPPGGYRFRVTACNDDGVWNEQGASARIRLVPWFYQTYWFTSLCLATAFASGGGILVARRSRAVARERELVRRVDQATRQLRESEERYRHLFNSNPNPMWVLDTRTLKFQAVNDAAVLHYGYSREEFLGMREPDLLAPEDMPAVVVWESVQGPGTEHDPGRRRFVKKDGTIIDVEVTSRTITFAGREATIVLAQDITARKRVEAQLEYQANHDALTGLPNRACLWEHLDRMILAARRSGEPFALLLVDLDRFKEINDTLGHLYGDSVLRQIGPRFGAALRASDVLARLGGDEFAVLLPGTDGCGALQMAERLLATLGEPFVLEGRRFDVGASIGIAAYAEHGQNPDELLRFADVAMYSAKRSQHGALVYAPEAIEHSSRQLSLASELRHGIENDELLLHYQPIFDLKSGLLHGAEALVRWQHPQDGLLSPDQFITLAEHTGLIKTLSLWVLNEVLVQSCIWCRAELNLHVSVNMTPSCIQDEGLVAKIGQLIEHAGTPASWLTIEVTESALMQDLGRARAVLGDLRALGVRIAIDDFGVGHSSLAYLKDLPVDEMKIDCCFIKALAVNPGTVVIVQSVIELGHALGMRVVAEGVEDRESLELLKSLGCDLAQGFLLGRPLSAARFTDLAWQTTGQSSDNPLRDPGR